MNMVSTTILPQGQQNIYEEAPESQRDLDGNAADEKGQQPQQKASKDALLRIHDQHLKFLSEGNVPIRSIVLPYPYPPSRVTVQDKSHKRVSLSDLIVDTRDPNAILLLHTITTPYVYSSTVTIAEDKNGDVARLTVNNLDDNMVDPIIIEGSVVALKQPCWVKLVNGGYHIRIDHPSDLILLHANDTSIPESWRRTDGFDPDKTAMRWKKDGDVMFLKKRFRRALELYDYGLRCCSKTSDPTCEIDLYRKRCGVNIVLLRLDDAAKDLSRAISIHAVASPTLSSTELTSFDAIESWLHNHSTEDPFQISSNIPRAFKELAARIKFDIGIFHNKPEYDLPVISSYVGPLTLHVDAANYTCDTEVGQTSAHGRGLFAKRAFKAGELICAEKAFALPGYFMQDRSSDCLLYSLSDGIAAPRPSAWLFKELVQKLSWNPSLRKEFFELDDGGYWEKNGWNVSDGADVPIDVFRVEAIRRYNCFAVPTRSSDLLNQAPNTNPELRNGFWIHGSYVNHSCLPNAVRAFIGDIRFLRAARDIRANEEITHHYVAPDIDYSDRQHKFSSAWSFECDCELCAVDGGVSESVRTERLKQFQDLKALVIKLSEKGTTVTSIKKIARGVRALETLYAPDIDTYEHLPRLALVHPTLFLTEAWRSVKNVEKMIEYAHKLLRNFGIITSVQGSKFEILSNSGLVNVETVRALKYLSEGYTSKGAPEIAQQCTAIAQQWFCIITGAKVGMEEFFRG